MIAKNFMKHPEALRFQHELFFNGYRNSPRIMRLMECIFDQHPSAPDWWTAAKTQARDLAMRVKKSMADFFKEIKVIKLTFSFEDDKTTYKPYRPQKNNRRTWTEQEIEDMFYRKAETPRFVMDKKGQIWTVIGTGYLCEDKTRTIRFSTWRNDHQEQCTTLKANQAFGLTEAETEQHLKKLTQ